MNKLITLSLAAVVFATAGFAQGGQGTIELDLNGDAVLLADTTLTMGGKTVDIAANKVFRVHGAISGSGTISGSGSVYKYDGTNSTAGLTSVGSDYYWVGLASDTSNPDYPFYYVTEDQYVANDAHKGSFGASSIDTTVAVRAATVELAGSSGFGTLLSGKNASDVIFPGAKTGSTFANQELVITGTTSGNPLSVGAMLDATSRSGYTSASMRLTNQVNLTNADSILGNKLYVDGTSAVAISSLPAVDVATGGQMTLSSCVIGGTVDVYGTGKVIASGNLVIGANITLGKSTSAGSGD